MQQLTQFALERAFARIQSVPSDAIMRQFITEYEKLISSMIGQVGGNATDADIFNSAVNTAALLLVFAENGDKSFNYSPPMDPRSNHSHFLATLADELNHQDSQGVVAPLFCVWDKVRHFGMSPKNSSKYVWCRKDDSAPVDLADLGLSEDDAKRSEDYRKVHYIERPRLLSAHLTHKAAKIWLSKQGRSYPRAYIHPISLTHCPELLALVQWLTPRQEAANDAEFGSPDTHVTER